MPHAQRGKKPFFAFPLLDPQGGEWETHTTASPSLCAKPVQATGLDLFAAVRLRLVEPHPVC